MITDKDATGEIIDNPPEKTKSIKSLEQPKKQKPSKNRILTKARRRKIIEAALDGKNITEVAIAEGYSPRTAAQQARQILSDPSVQRSFVRIMEEQGITDNFLAQKGLALLNAKKTVFFQKDGVCTDKREVEALETQRKTWETATKLKGHLRETSSGDTSIALMQMVVNVVNEPEHKE